MKYRLLIIMIISIVMLAPALSYSDESQDESYDLVETLEKGRINWTKGAIEATGVMLPDKQLFGNFVHEGRFVRIALNDAYRNLLDKVITIALRAGYKNLRDVVKSVRIDADTLVQDLAINNDFIMAEIESMIKSAQLVKKDYLSDGTVKITLQMSLYGGFSQLVLPNDIKLLESIKILKKNSDKTASVPLSRDDLIDLSDVEKTYTGVVVDARGLKANPALAPIIQDENGENVFGPPVISREFAIQHGISGYSTTLETARRLPRVAGNPLTVKGLRAKGSGASVIVISNADASKLRRSSKHLEFLKQCRVVIVMDQMIAKTKSGQLISSHRHEASHLQYFTDLGTRIQ
ncbi:hypothetical protein QUF75_07890 [Desulfococcaceae bacterium HSG7]|nr:hypothetical protein [Desulfococcaceae bacterium HSG7]